MRLKTKILLAILGTLFLVVAALSLASIAQLLRQRMLLSYANNTVIAHEVLSDVRHSLETGLRGKQIDPNDADALPRLVADALQQDPNMDAVLASVIRYSPAVYDITVVDTAHRAVLTTDSGTLNLFIGPRPDFATLVHSSLLHQVRTVFGPPQVFDISVPLDRNGLPFLTVRVGIRTTFLQHEILPSLRNAITLALLLALGAFMVSALLANLALRPLTLVSERLTELSGTTGEPIPKASDEVAVVSSKIQRIGERMRNVQEVFTALKQNMDQVLGSLQDGLVLFTQDGRAILVSASAAKFLNMDRNAMLGSRIEDILDRSTRLGKLVRDAFDARCVLVQEEMLAEDGRCLQVSLDFLHDDRNTTGQAMGALLTLHDTESVQQLEADLELSSRLAAIGRLTAGVGHEVKNPINAIVVHVELLRNKLSEMPADATRHVDIILGEAQRLNRVVQTLVDFSRPVDLRQRDCDLRTIVTGIAELESPSLVSAGIELDLRLTEDTLPVHVDSDLIKQALLNLVQNAAHAMPHGGALTITAERTGRDACITVQDTGTGIPAEQLDKIFNLYFTTKETGSGIGLAMTYRIMQLHNGKIDVESTVGNGSAFTLVLPMSATDSRTRGLPSAVREPSIASVAGE